jgi:nucleotide-binding universal stress UspA family protein
MLALKRILIPTDFSEHSGIALNYACEFARRFDAELHVLHVVQDVYSLLPEPGLAFPPPGDYMADLRASAEKSLGDVLKAADAAGVRVVREVREGVPFLEIVRYAKEREIDLIVIGTHGRSGLAHVLMGSVAERVVRKAPCPVLAVRLQQHQFALP